jgi:hypothetical protein
MHQRLAEAYMEHCEDVHADCKEIMGKLEQDLKDRPQGSAGESLNNTPFNQINFGEAQHDK